MDQNRFSNLYLNGNLLIGDVDVISQINANSNFMKAIKYSNTDLTNLIESCNKNVSNYLNRLDVLTIILKETVIITI